MSHHYSGPDFGFPRGDARLAARNMKITLPADHAVDAEIDLGPEGGAFSLAAQLYVSLPGMERATAQRLVEAAHQVCPCSRATHGNIAVETMLV
jgi:lipoyl-dependent peroxiredoxin